MARGATIRVKGLREFSRAAVKAEKQTKSIVKEHLGRAAEPVRREGQQLFERYDVKSASGFRVRVWGRGYGVFVEQSKRKRTGKRPDYGALQMKKALIPALDRKSDQVERELERAVDRLADILD